VADSTHGKNYYVDRESHLRGGGYVARCLELGVTSEGETVEEAVAMLREAVELYLEDEPLPSNLTHPVLTSFDITVDAA
jgi:predicted RNase H-like HicB family nuclease